MRVLLIAACLAAAACDDADPPPGDMGPRPLFALDDLAEMHEVVPCRHSHEHDLRHVRIFGDLEAGRQWFRCVRQPGECVEPFPPGARFVKLEYDRAGCLPEELESYTVSVKVAPGALPAGGDWHWQRLDRDLNVTDDGAPPVCVRCHVDHCAPPYGHDLRCTPD